MNTSNIFIISLFIAMAVGDFSAMIYSVDNNYKSFGEPFGGSSDCYNFTDCQNKLCNHLTNKTSLPCGFAATSSVIMYPLLNDCNFTDVPILKKVSLLAFMSDLANDSRPIKNTMFYCNDLVNCIRILCKIPSPEFGQYGFKGFCL